MTWQETHRRNAALREIERIADGDPTGTLPWAPAYAEIFRDPPSLLVALRYRWRLLAECQLDPELGREALTRSRSRLEAEHAGLVRVLRRHDGRLPDPWGRAAPTGAELPTVPTLPGARAVGGRVHAA